MAAVSQKLQKQCSHGRHQHSLLVPGPCKKCNLTLVQQLKLVVNSHGLRHYNLLLGLSLYSKGGSCCLVAWQPHILTGFCRSRGERYTRGQRSSWLPIHTKSQVGYTYICVGVVCRNWKIIPLPFTNVLQHLKHSTAKLPLVGLTCSS